MAGNKKPRVIAFYLPQYHPIPENDGWYGRGYTEWVNVAQARAMFPGHYQPHIPADLGFYDLRLPEIRRAQADMAASYGVDAFCYWTYWFGGGRRLLTMPLEEVLRDETIKLPFCIAWANHDWSKKSWDPNGNGTLLMKQEYLGKDDYAAFFREYLSCFHDARYFRVDGKPLVIVHNPLEPALKEFLECWRSMAKQHGLGDFYFVGKDTGYKEKDSILSMGFDAVYEDNVFNIHHESSKLKKGLWYLGRRFLKRPTSFQYEKAVKYMVSEMASDEHVIPLIAPNWDHTPRSGGDSILLRDCEPKYFGEVCNNAFRIVQDKSEQKRIVIIKSWNEWGEGNHMEPDRRYGRGYLEELRKALELF